MKKILFVSAFAPNRKTAGTNYTRNLLLDLASGCKIDLLYFNSIYDIEIEKHDNINIVWGKPITKYQKAFNCLMFPFLYPFFTSRFNLLLYFKIRRALKKGNYDYLYLDFSQTFVYGLFFPNIPKILMAHDIIIQRYQRAHNNYLINKFVFWSEKILLNQRNVKVFTFSEKDSALTLNYYKVKSEVTTFYLDQDILNLSINTPDDYYVLYAAWNRPENLSGLEWFIENVIPSIKENVHIKIIGGGMPELLRQRLLEIESIEILGFVQNPYPCIANAKALIAPLFKGAGVKVKVIESLACGTPVIGTETALEGVDSLYNSSLCKCNTPEEFINLLNNFDFSTTRKLQLRNCFLENYSQNKVVKYIL